MEPQNELATITESRLEQLDFQKLVPIPRRIIKRIHVSRLPLDGIMNYQGVFTVTLT